MPWGLFRLWRAHPRSPVTGPDPTYLLSIQTCGVLPLANGNSSNSDAFYCNKTFDNLFAKQATEFNTAQRVQTIAAMQQNLYKASVDVMLFYADGLSAVRTDQVKNFFYGKPDGRACNRLAT